MGNRHSSHRKLEKAKRRERTPQRRSSARPASWSPEVSGFVLRPPTATTDLGGRPPSELQISMNPIGSVSLQDLQTAEVSAAQTESANVQDLRAAKVGKSPSGRPYTPANENEVVESLPEPLGRSVRDVLNVWPEYAAIAEIPVSRMTASQAEVLAQVLNRMCQQHVAIGELVRLKRTAAHATDVVHAKLLRAQEQVDGRDRDILLLKGQLKRRGFDPDRVLMASASPQERALLPLPEDGVARRPDYSKVYQATPLLLAHAANERGVHRSASSVSPGVHPVGRRKFEERSDSSTPPPKDARAAEIRELQEMERARTEVLQQRIRVLELASSATATECAPSCKQGDQRDRQLEALVVEFGELEHEASSRFLRCVKHCGGRDSSNAQLASFNVAIVMASFRRARALRESLYEELRCLLNSPLNSGRLTSPDIPNLHSGRLTSPNVPNLHSGRLASESAEQPELPMAFTEQVYMLLQKNAQRIDVKEMALEVLDEVSRHAKSIITSKLLAQSSGFVERSCRLSWQLVIHRPPLYVATEPANAYDERFHKIIAEDERLLSSAGSVYPSMRIDHFQWPILFRQIYGDVLRRGQVRLRDDRGVEYELEDL